MRILISICHTDLLPAALYFAEQAHEHELWLMPGVALGADLDSLQQNFSGLVPPTHIIPVPMPLLGQGSWFQAAAAIVQDYRISQFNADYIYRPELEDDPLQVLERLASQQVTAAHLDGSQKPTLAYISPLPPERTGIADYSAELLPELARHYQITVILAQSVVDCPWVEQHLDIRDIAWFRQHSQQFERIVYHIGNSPMHAHMFDLLAEIPGVVVLHDFFLSNVLYHLQEQTGLFEFAAFESHGYTGVVARQRGDLNSFVWSHPCNLPVLQQAGGVIVHSTYARKLAQHWYGPTAGQDWIELPLLRQSSKLLSRANARAALGLKVEDFLVCSFGMLGPTKLNHRLLEVWQTLNSKLMISATLVFVGENDPTQYGLQMAGDVARTFNAKITGYVDAELYHLYLAACDVAVQLRSNSRGETSAAVLDCMLAGVPTIVNAHGAMTELPDHTLLKISDNFCAEELRQALGRLRQDTALRQQLGSDAAIYVKSVNAADQVGDRYHQSIEQLVSQHPRYAYQRLLQKLAQLGPASTDDLIGLAQTLAAVAPPRLPQRLFVDISALVQEDLKTGIQRVVRAILLALIAQPPSGFRIEPVYSLGDGNGYRYARRWVARTLQWYVPDSDDAPIDARARDQFLGLDFFTYGTCANQAYLQEYARRGVQLSFVVYDLLPLLRPDCFPPAIEVDFHVWLQMISAVADSLVCISAAVADELNEWMFDHRPQRQHPLEIATFHLGADISASQPSLGLPVDAAQILAIFTERPTILMVGTVEPRKGQRQALKAFEQLWRNQVDVNLVIVGKSGWMMDDFQQQMDKHAELGQRLFWLQGISDEMLHKVYAASSALLAASEGEGFGLPLIEAAQHGLHILARDIPVFREVAGAHASYFTANTSDELASAVALWLERLKYGDLPDVRELQWLSWAQSSQQLLAALSGQRTRYLIDM